MASYSARELRSPQNTSYGSPSGTADAREGGQCWICYGDGPGLIAPCQCTGSMRWVHRRCLDRWRVDATNPRNFTHCRHCGAAFQLVLKRPPTEDGAQLRERRRRFLQSVLSHFAVTAVCLQLGLCTVALLLRALDPKEQLVVVFNLHQIEGTPPAGEGDFWNAVLHHKSTYYLAAALLALFCTGLLGVLALCYRGCSAPRGGRSTGSGDVDICFCQPCYPVDNTMDTCCDCLCDCRNCPECDIGHCRSGDNCNCPDFNCSGGDGGSCEGCLACLVGAALFIAIAFVVAGVFFVLMAVVTWLQKVATRYMQLSELRALTGEYVVRDLSSEEMYLDIEQPPVQQDLSAPRDPARSMWWPSSLWGQESPAMDPALQDSLTRDLEAVYGTQVVS